MGIKTDSLVRTRDGLDHADCPEYIKFPGQTDTETDERIRRATATGRPLGDDQFLKNLERKLTRCLVPKKAGRPRKNRK
jgi:putative transposase